MGMEAGICGSKVQRNLILLLDLFLSAALSRQVTMIWIALTSGRCNLSLTPQYQHISDFVGV